MKVRYSIALFVFVIACTPQNENNGDSDLVLDSVVNKIEQSQKVTDTVKITKPSFVSDSFIELVNFIDSAGFICDTNRINKVGGYAELNNKNLVFVNGYSFYKVNINTHSIFRCKKLNDESISKYHEALKEDSTIEEKFFIVGENVNYEAFKKVQSIYGYFYRKNIDSGWIHDGMIEEWKFNTKNEAIAAITEVKKIGYLLYFNTEPYYFQKDNYFYIFHTRAAAFNYTLKKFYIRFKQE